MTMKDPEQLELDEYSTGDIQDSLLLVSSSTSTNADPLSKMEITHQISSLQDLALKVIRKNPNCFFALHNVLLRPDLQKEIDKIVKARIKEIESDYLVKVEKREDEVSQNVKSLSDNYFFGNAMGCANGILWFAIYLAIGIPLLRVMDASPSTRGLFYGFTIAPFIGGGSFGIALTKKIAKVLVESCTPNIPKPVMDCNIEAQLPRPMS